MRTQRIPSLATFIFKVEKQRSLYIFGLEKLDTNVMLVM